MSNTPAPSHGVMEAMGAAQKRESLTTNTEALTPRAESINDQPRSKRSCCEVVISSCVIGCVLAPPFIVHAADDVSPAEARAIAKEAYIYGFPMVDGYRIQYAYFVDPNQPRVQSALEPNPEHPPGPHAR